MYKVFFNDRKVFLTDNFNDHIKRSAGLFYQYDNKSGIQLLIDTFENNIKVDNLFIYNDDLNELQFVFKSCFTFMEAAGGVVRNDKGEILVIKRHGKWDLPKGKVEKGEEIKHAALREVTEECGINDIKIIKNLKPTYHTYKLNESSILKETHWFEMHYSGDENLIPQVEEGITEVRWVLPSEIELITDNTYASIVDVLIDAHLS